MWECGCQIWTGLRSSIVSWAGAKTDWWAWIFRAKLFLPWRVDSEAHLVRGRRAPSNIKPDGSILIHTQGSSWLLGFQYVFLGFLFSNNEILEASLPCRGIIQPWAQNGSKIHIQYPWTSLFSPCPVLRQCRRCRRPTLSPSNASLCSYVLCNYVQENRWRVGTGPSPSRMRLAAPSHFVRFMPQLPPISASCQRHPSA